MPAVDSRLAVIGLSLLLALVSGCGEKKTPPRESPRVSVQEVKRQDFAAPVSLTGDIQARVQTQLSFRVGGKIIQRLVDVGARVTAQQVLAKLDPKDLQTNVNSAEAAVGAQQAQVKEATTAFWRQQQLLPKGYTSRSEYDQAKATLDSSKNALAASQAQLANARKQLGYTDLVADAPGIITARQAEVGQVVQAATPIFGLARDGDRDAVFNVYESLFVKPPTDQPVTITLLDNPNVKAYGKVREVTPEVSANTGTLQVKVTLQDVPAEMPLGAVVSAALTAPARPSVELPWAALTKQDSDPAVWLVNADSKVDLHKVKVGRYLSGKVIIADGLQGGEKVVVAGGQLLHPGMLVEVADQTTAQNKEAQP